MTTAETQKYIKLALKLLSVRDHFKDELILKLKIKGAQKEQISDTINYLNEFSYLDDLKTLSKFSHEVAGKSRGLTYLLKKLYEKGCIGILNNYDVSTFYTKEMEIESAEKYCNRFLDPEPNELEKKLYSRGFSSETVRIIIKKVKRGN